MIENLWDIDGNPVRFFHGTTVDLTSGDVLLPGNQIGVSVHLRSDHVYATSTWVRPEVEDDVYLEEFFSAAAAADEAASWAAHAADLLCDGWDCCSRVSETDPQPHYDCWREGTWPTCIKVYEVIPVNPDDLEPDHSDDVVHGGVKTSAARVLARVDAFADPVAAPVAG